MPDRSLRGVVWTILESYPRLRATRIFQMVRDRGYTGSVVQLRRLVGAACVRCERKRFCDSVHFPESRPKRTGHISVKYRWVVPVGVCPAF